MAVYTNLDLSDADRVARAHGLGGARSVEGVLAGSVNSNFFVETDARRVFVRIYEEQDVEGLRYEHALLDHLGRAGVPVPARVPMREDLGPIRVGGKPVAIFEVLGGDEVCQRMVDVDRARAVGETLAHAHAACSDFPLRRSGRFTMRDVRARFDAVVTLSRPELADGLRALRAALDEVDARWDAAMPSGVIHGDLFRDNVRWEGPRIVAILDWESASDGLYAFDLAVAMLAWCWGDHMRWDLAAAMAEGYSRARTIEPRERRFMRTALLAAAARFTITRITDYHLREGAAQVKKDWRRFLARLTAVMALDEREIEALLFRN